MSLPALAIETLAKKGVPSADIMAVARAILACRESDIIAKLVIDLAALDCPVAAILLAAQAFSERPPSSNLESDRERARRYRERRGLSDTDWYGLRNAVFERDGFICKYCGTTRGPFHCDHIVPLNRDGTNELENLAVACGQCNSSKGDRLLSEWSPPRGGWLP